MRSITSIHHVSLSVRNLETTARWYNEVLGLALLRHSHGASFERAILGSGQGTPVFGLTQHRGNEGRPFSETATGMDHLAFSIASPVELRAQRDRLEELGLAYGAPREGLVVLRDPDNIQVELCCP
jgi:catechol 2,3-dioxygenase-like lactoylglutathione lyase family enzyme